MQPDQVTHIRVTVAGQDGAQDLTADLSPQSAAFRATYAMQDRLAADELGIPVLGLYPSARNEVSFRVGDDSRAFTGHASITTTNPPEAGDVVDVHASVPERMEPGLTYLNGRVYDRLGHLRWLGPDIYRITQRGTILSDTTEVNWLGKVLNQWVLPSELRSHQHDTIELPNGNIVVAVNNSSTSIVDADGQTFVSEEDFVVELDRESNIENAWDLRPYLDVSRSTVSAVQGDWVHVNTLAYDEQDDALLVSARFQGILKLTRGGVQGAAPNQGKSLVWILAPRMGWELAGWDGGGPLDPGKYLLTAVDASGNPYGANVQQNLAAPEPTSDAFFWPIGQHGIRIVGRSDRTITFLTFNNQASFLFDGVDSVDNGTTWETQGDLTNDRSALPYSQIIEYEVDEVDMTVKRIWSFGGDRPELYGGFNGGVNRLSTTENLLMVSNGADQHDPDGLALNPHVIEVTPRGEVVFHLEIQDTNLSAYRSGRVDLFHPARTE